MSKLCGHCYNECSFYPCHEGIKDEEFSCLFCTCPLYHTDCTPHGGTPSIVETKSGRLVKDCSNCTFPHLRQNEQKIWDILKGGF